MRLTRIHVTGASGSGTTTLGQALAARLGIACFDSDDFLWQATDPPYQRQHDEAERKRLLEAACNGADDWVLAGSVFDWGDLAMPGFDLVVFLVVPTQIRIERLRRRETELFGEESVAPGGAYHADFNEFLDWAAAYDRGDREGRSLPRHEAWLAGLTCPVVRIEGEPPLETSLNRCLTVLAPKS